MTDEIIDLKQKMIDKKIKEFKDGYNIGRKELIKDEIKFLEELLDKVYKKIIREEIIRLVLNRLEKLELMEKKE